MRAGGIRTAVEHDSGGEHCSIPHWHFECLDWTQRPLPQASADLKQVHKSHLCISLRKKKTIFTQDKVQLHNNCYSFQKIKAGIIFFK